MKEKVYSFKKPSHEELLDKHQWSGTLGGLKALIRKEVEAILKKEKEEPEMVDWSKGLAPHIKKRDKKEGIRFGTALANEGARLKEPLASANSHQRYHYPIVKGSRHNKDKRKWSLVHYKSLEPLVEVLEFGAKKYAPENWKKGLDKKEILESMMRHLTALMDGEENDKESGLHHIGHLMCNAMFYEYFDAKERNCCSCEAPLVRGYGDEEYCGLCQKRFMK